MMAEAPAIYGLFDAAGRLRYIGKANDPEARLKGHMRDARRRDTPLYRWIRKNGKPTMRVLWENDGEWDWRDVERLLIAGFRDEGCKLLNVADGGDEPHCPTATRQENGRRNARATHDDPVRKALWRRKQLAGIARAPYRGKYHANAK